MTNFKALDSCPTTAVSVTYPLNILMIWGMFKKSVLCVSMSMFLVRLSQYGNESHVVGGPTDLK